MSKIALIISNESEKIRWNLGSKMSLNDLHIDLIEKRKEILSLEADYLLFWDAENAIPSKEVLNEVISSPGELWHIGPKLGLNGFPKTLDYVQPTNMLHAVGDLEKDHSSWKMSFQGCLMEKSIFEFIEVTKGYDSAEIMGLDFGYQAMRSGVFTKYSILLSENIQRISYKISLKDQTRFIQKNFDNKAYFWLYLNSLFLLSPLFFLKELQRKKNSSKTFQHKKVSINDHEDKVSIVIATLNRYQTLKEELEELRKLSYKPHEIIIVDQTIKELRSSSFLKDFSDLPIIYLESDITGQCTARNLGVEHATGNVIWFLDDDMKEFPVDYLDKHLTNLHARKADVSCGIPDEVGTNYVNRDEIQIHISDGFPTNDVLLKKELFHKVGGFDVKMDRLQSEDQELGLRCVKEGALIIKSNQLRLLHLRAPQGGLRSHKVRKITFSSARNSLIQRRLAHYSEIYIAMKHFSERQVRSYISLNVRGTFIIRGNPIRKLLKVIIGLFLVPHTLHILKKRKKLAKSLISK